MAIDELIKEAVTTLGGNEMTEWRDISTHKSFKRGDKVNIISTTYAGDLAIEGVATIIKHAGTDDYYTVRFADGTITERFVQQGIAQYDPAAYITLPERL